LIGAKGANINKLRSELGVEINLKEGQGEIKGIQVAVDAARRKHSSQIKEFLDKAVEHLKVPQEFHSAVIGSGGNSVRKLENRYGVRIMFPRSAKDKSASDTDGAEVTSKQAPNEVIIRGGKDGVSKARAEIVALLEYEMEKNHTATVPVTSRAIEFMFKNAAKEIKQLRDDQDLRIDIPQRDAVVGPGEKLTIKIRGTEDQVKHAKTVLSRIVKEAEQTVSRTISVEKKYHRSLIGAGGQTLKEIVVGAGGPDDRQAFARMVRFPSQDSEADEITVQGNLSVVEKIIKSIEKIVEEKKNQVSTTIEVAPEKHRQLIGREGSIRKELEARFGVTIDIPRQKPGQVSSSDIKITGIEENVQKAKEHIVELVKETEGETVQVARHLYYTVAEALRRLPREYRVSVEHAGQSRPPRAEEPRPELNGNLPLITDDDDVSQRFTWEVVEQTRASGDEDLFPWVLRGKPEAIAQAKTEIEKVVAAAETQSSIGYLVLPDPSKFRFVVGPGGTQVERIRCGTGCHVTVPRSQSVGEPITIYGSKEGVEKAKDIILGLVKAGGINGESNGGRGRRRY
jgi:predicted PilT family ATPase